MKKNDILILLSLGVYTFLFYHENPGINFLLFSVIMVTLLLLKDNLLLKNKLWLGAAAGSILSGIAVLMNSSILSVTANIISLTLLASFSMNRNSSLLVAGIHSLYSYLSSIPYLIYRFSENTQRKQNSKNIGAKILIIVLPIVVTLVFFAIYRSANPVFKAYTDELNFDFISWEWIRFVLFGWILLYAFFNHVNIPYLTIKDSAGNDNLLKDDLASAPVERTNYEKLAGIILLVLLNLLLLFVNVIDVQSLYTTTPTLPSGMTHADFVHQGVGLLIVSIVIAISIILFFFRGALNFYPSTLPLKIMAYVWIVQNAVLILTTASKNQLYIDEYSLTYKRIGVYVYLLLSFIGLASTFLKISMTKSNWFLFRKNAWAFYSVLIAACFVNWDLLIAQYNISHSKNLDRSYLLELSESTLPDLIKTPMDPNSGSSGTDIHVYNFFEKIHRSGWPSWDMEDSRIKNELIELQSSKLTSLDLTGKSDLDIKIIYPLKDLKRLQLDGTQFRTLSELDQFQNLENLSMNSNGIDSIHTLPSFKKLKTLSLANNAIADFSYLNNCPELEELDINGNTKSIQQFPELKKLRKLDLSKCSVYDVNDIKKFPSIEELSLTSFGNGNIHTLPALSTVTTLQLNANTISHKDSLAFLKIAEFQNLKNLDLSSNSLEELLFLDYLKGLNVTTLNLASNPIKNISGIEHLSSLKTLYLDNTRITTLKELAPLTQLEVLSVTNCSLVTADLFPLLPNVKALNLSYNDFKSLQGIENLTGLESLDLFHCNISDIQPISRLTKLKKLNIGYNHISDLSALESLQRLEKLRLAAVNVTSIEPLKNLKSLKYLEINGLTDAQLKELKLANPDLIISSPYHESAPDYTTVTY